MRAVNVPVISGMGRRLPVARAVTSVVQQEVDMRPAGNTIAVETVSDNPFEDNARIEVVSQASGGGYEVPAEAALPPQVRASADLHVAAHR